MINPSRRNLIVFSLFAVLLLIWSVRLLSPWDYRATWNSAKGALSTQLSGPGNTPPGSNGVQPSVVDVYFEQAFSRETPSRYDYPGLQEACGRTAWRDDVYVKCQGMSAGMTSIVNQVKVCLKIAIETGSHIVLPAMPLRDSTDLQQFNIENKDAYMTYDQWFDVDHLREVMGRTCPKLKIVHPNELDVSVPVKHHWEILCSQATGFPGYGPFFWVGNPYDLFFQEQLELLQRNQSLKPEENKKTGITLIDVDSKFVLFRITDDPTGQQLRIWNDLAIVIRYKQEPREIANRLVDKLKLQGAYYGVHFRVEKDSFWSSFEHQLSTDLDGLDKAWAKFGSFGLSKPVVYVACGDVTQAQRFVKAAAERGWEATHKWKLLEDDPETTTLVNALPFDFQGAVDLGIMMRAQFFFGITGSAFSSTVSQLRDPSGRYRGSSLQLADDAGARSHLFFDGDAGGYPCCL